MSAKAGESAAAQENPLQTTPIVHERGCKYYRSQVIPAAVIVSTDESDTTDSTADDDEDNQENPEECSKALAAIVFSDDDDDSSSTLVCQEVVGQRKTKRRKSEPAAGPIPAVVLSEDDSDSASDAKEVRSPDDSILSSANPATMESLSAFTGVKGLRVRILNLAATRYEITAEASETPFLKAQFRCPPKGCCGGGGHREGSSGGPFTIDISDFCSVAETTLVRVSCSSAGSVMVESPESVVIGYVAAQRILCGVNFIIRDIYGTARMVVKGPSFCRSKCQHTEVFEVLRPDQTAEAAKLNRANGANEYTLTMPESMTADMKAALLCASLLFDRKMFA